MGYYKIAHKVNFRVIPCWLVERMSHTRDVSLVQIGKVSGCGRHSRRSPLARDQVRARLID
jgi:hypothetical protein